MIQAKHDDVSTCRLQRRINRALARSHKTLWFTDDSALGPYMIVVGNKVQAAGIADLEALARELGVMNDWEFWSDSTARH